MTRRMEPEIPHQALRRTVHLVVLLNLAYFGIEFAAARAIGSVSLFADSIDFLEDASVNFLVIVAIGWTARNRGRVGIALAGILLVPAMATLWTAWGKLALPVAPDAALLALTGAGALAVNLVCALMLARSPSPPRQPHQGSIPLGAQRRVSKHRHYRRGARDGPSSALRVAGLDRRIGHCRLERSSGRRGLAGGTAGTSGRSVGALLTQGPRWLAPISAISGAKDENTGPTAGRADPPNGATPRDRTGRTCALRSLSPGCPAAPRMCRCRARAASAPRGGCPRPDRAGPARRCPKAHRLSTPTPAWRKLRTPDSSAPA